MFSTFSGFNKVLASSCISGSRCGVFIADAKKTAALQRLGPPFYAIA